MKRILPLLLALTLASCSTHEKKKEIRNEASSQTAATDAQTLGTSIQDLIRSSKTLTDEQKKKLEDVIAVNKQTADDLAEKSYRFRSVLIKELLSDKPDLKKVKLIKNDIKQIEASRLKNTFDAVEKITHIVSGTTEEDQFAKHLIQMERPIR